MCYLSEGTDHGNVGSVPILMAQRLPGKNEENRILFGLSILPFWLNLGQELALPE